MLDLIPKENAIRAEFDVQITTAKAYPRDIEKCLKQSIFLATFDEETAESCIYSLPRGKDSKGAQAFLKGKSVRLAEIMVSAWGNLHAATRIVENDGKSITTDGVMWDLETNVKVTKQVKRSIVDRSGRTFSNDMQVVTANAAQSIVFRNCAFTIIPQAFVNKVYNEAVKAAIGDQTKLSEKVKKLIERFKKLGINQEKIFAYFNKKEVHEITQDEVEEMIGIGTAIKEGSLTIEKAFVEAQEEQRKLSALEDKIQLKKNELAAEVVVVEAPLKAAQEFFGENDKV